MAETPPPLVPPQAPECSQQPSSGPDDPLLQVSLQTTLQAPQVLRVASFDVGTRNLSLCVVDCAGWGPGNTMIPTVVHWEVCDILGKPDDDGKTAATTKESDKKTTATTRKSGKKTTAKKKKTSKAKKVSVEEATRCMVAYLESRRSVLATAHIMAIESQPAMRISNIKTKVLSHIIQAWWHQARPGAPVRFCSPKRKLRGVPGMEEANLETNARKRYTLHKKLCVDETCRRIEGSPWVDFFNNLPKKDDATDAYLQACWVAEEHNVPGKKRKRGQKRPRQ